jgi:hypothetical protein
MTIAINCKPDVLTHQELAIYVTFMAQWLFPRIIKAARPDLTDASDRNLEVLRQQDLPVRG